MPGAGTACFGVETGLILAAPSFPGWPSGFCDDAGASCLNAYDRKLGSLVALTEIAGTHIAAVFPSASVGSGGDSFALSTRRRSHARFR